MPCTRGYFSVTTKLKSSKWEKALWFFQGNVTASWESSQPERILQSGAETETGKWMWRCRLQFKMSFFLFLSSHKEDTEKLCAKHSVLYIVFFVSCPRGTLWTVVALHLGKQGSGKQAGALGKNSVISRIKHLKLKLVPININDGGICILGVVLNT